MECLEAKSIIIVTLKSHGLFSYISRCIKIEIKSYFLWKNGLWAYLDRKRNCSQRDKDLPSFILVDLLYIYKQTFSFTIFLKSDEKYRFLLFQPLSQYLQPIHFPLFFIRVFFHFQLTCLTYFFLLLSTYFFFLFSSQ